MNQVTEIIRGMMAVNEPSDYWYDATVYFSELENSHSVQQRDRRSVWEHTMRVLDALTVKNPTTLLSGLFHDLGKYYIDPTDDPSRSKFPGHAGKSAEIAKARLEKWGANPDLVDSVVRVVSTHMFDIRDVTQDKTIRKFVASVGKDNVENWFVLRMADSSSYSGYQRYVNYLIEPFRRAVVSYLERQPSSEPLDFEPNDVIGGIQIKGGEEE